MKTEDFLEVLEDRERAAFVEARRALEILDSIERRKLVLDWLRELTVDIPLLEQSPGVGRTREEQAIIARRCERLTALYMTAGR